MPFLEIKDLTYTYPGSEVRALNGFSMDADPGRIIALIGPNAAGKSTLALILKGLLQHDSGEITVDHNKRVDPGPDQRVGILFSNPENQLVTSIVEEDVAFGLEVLGEQPGEIEEKVGNVLHRLDIEHLRKRMPHLMSGGEQQMAALAGVLVLDPDILVLDEPTTYLDPDARIAVLAFLRQLAEQGKIIILITHNMKEAVSADRVLLMDQGRVAAEGAPDEVFNMPDLTGRFGIHPPFTYNISMELKKMGASVKNPIGPANLATALLGYLKDHAVPDLEVAVPDARENSHIPALAYDQIRFSYGQDMSGKGPILKGVDFSVERGCIALICGANGSGKSTLLQMSNGLVVPDSGAVLLDGRQVRILKRNRGGLSSRVALLFQNPERQVFSATVFEDIAFGPRNLGLSSQVVKQRVLKAARWTGLTEEILHRSVFALSGGQMRRVAVAGVLAMEPDVLVLDEPVDGLDPGSAREFFTNARRYCDETGTTIVMATHAVPEEVAGIDHVGHLADGVIQSAGSPSDILTGPGRTIPSQFLPDHLVLIEELVKSGIHLPGKILDPVDAGRFLLAILEEGPL